jgi:hypothetical protein
MDIALSDHSVSDDEMSRARNLDTTTGKSAASYVVRLKASVGNQPGFDRVVQELLADKALAAADVILVATKFAIPAQKISSKTAALAAIKKRYVELVRFNAKNALAAKARPW